MSFKIGLNYVSVSLFSFEFCGPSHWQNLMLKIDENFERSVSLQSLVTVFSPPFLNIIKKMTALGKYE